MTGIRNNIGTLCVAAALAAPGPGHANETNEAFAWAMQAVEESDYLNAALYMRAAAEQGEPRAQEILGFMLMWGEQIYGPAIQQDPIEGLKWLKHAAANGREAAAHFLRRQAERRNDAPAVPQAH